MPPRKRKARPQASRCAYQDGGRRCTRPGIGNPPLCTTHRAVLEEAALPKTAVGDFLSDLLTGKKVNAQKAGAAAVEVLGAFFAAGAAQARQTGQPFKPFAPFAPFAPWGAFSNPPIPGGAPDPRRAPRPPPPPDDDHVRRLQARKLLGFTATETLTREGIRKRQRELGRKFHPDLQPPEKRDAATKRMALISGACSLLMEDLR